MRTGSSFGTLEPFLDEPELSLSLKGNRVVDLGAGGMGLAKVLQRRFDVEHVIAVEKEPMYQWVDTPGITRVTSYFDAFSKQPRTWAVAFLAWPDNHVLPGLIAILEESPCSIVLANNLNGTMCGWPELWEYLRTRTVRVHIPHPRNSLTIYDGFSALREPTTTEAAGMDLNRVYY